MQQKLTKILFILFTILYNFSVIGNEMAISFSLFVLTSDIQTSENVRTLSSNILTINKIKTNLKIQISKFSTNIINCEE